MSNPLIKLKNELIKQNINGNKQKIKKKDKKVIKNKEKINKNTKEYKEFQKEKYEFEQKFYKLMFELGLYNKFNRTYYLQIIEKTPYGFYAQLYLESGLSFSMLQKEIGNIQQILCCIFIVKIKVFRNYAQVQIVINPMDEEMPYENPEIKPWQIYLGLSFSMKPIIIDVNDFCMFLMAGATGSGKTVFVYQILLSWILGCSCKEVEIWIADIAKNEYINFEHVKHVKFYAYELEQLDRMMIKLEKEFERRKKLISITREKGIATNIREYNKISKDKLSYIYIFTDEFSVLLPDKTDSKDEKETKQRILDSIKRLSKTARGMGMFTFEALQKTVKEEIPSIIKSQSAVRISFRANDSISSEVIMGNNAAVGLSKRYAVYSLNGGEEQDYLFSPYLDTNMLNRMLEPHIDEKFKIKKVNFDNKFYNPNIIEIKSKLKPYKKEVEQIIPKVISLKKKKDDIPDY